MDLERRATVHAALGDPHRLAIVDELRASDRSPSELAARLTIRPSLLAFHLDHLETAGLVRRTPSDADRRRKYVQLVRTAVDDLVPQRPATADGVLFVCTHNSARSQLAAALWRQHRNQPASSAGTEPAERIHPDAVDAAARAGLDLTHERPRALTTADAALPIITVCDRAYEELGRTTRHWSVPDPVGAPEADAFDRTLVTIRERVLAFDRPDPLDQETS